MKPLVTCGWLAGHLTDPDLRVLDCSVVFGVTEQGGFTISPARDDWAAGHIPGSVLADLPGALSDDASEIPLMMAPPEEFAEAMGRYGVGPGTRVVLYDPPRARSKKRPCARCGGRPRRPVRRIPRR